MEYDQDFQDRVQAITEIRAKAMEANRAFNAVMRLRGDLAEARNMLAFAISDQRQPVERVNSIQQHIGNIEADLSNAERYCREVNPDRLQRHDDELAQAARSPERRESRKWLSIIVPLKRTGSAPVLSPLKGPGRSCSAKLRRLTCWLGSGGVRNARA